MKKDLKKIRAYIDAIDFAPIKKLMSMEDREGWSMEKLDFMEKQYRNVLFLWAKYEGEMLPPSKDIDDFWHNHILRTRQYHKDCEVIFGRYMHHNPGFGMDNEEEHAQLLKGFSNTLAFYEKEYGEELYDIEEVAEEEEAA